MASGVEFDEDKFSYGRPRPTGSMPATGGSAYPQTSYGSGERIPGLTGWLVRHHLAKSENSAQYVMVGIIIINIIITFLVIKFIL